ncbi:MAG TPA: response regulator [Bacteroidales bacterium]|nr:response regulator [Bacteroidales bacterium]
MTLNYNDIQLPGKNILIVEDDIPSIKYYETLLKSTGANVTVFRNGKDFVDFITHNSGKIDLVFMDFLVPLVNGIECIRILRKDRNKVPVLMITAYASEQSKTESFLAGCNEYILKPVYPEKIVEMLEKYLIPQRSATAV